MVIHDLRYGARLLLKSPGFALAAILTLALGIGATTAIFSAVHGILLAPLPFPQPDRVVTVWSWTSRGDEPFYGSSGPDYLDWVERNTKFEALAAVNWHRLTLVTRDEPQPIVGYGVTANYFDVFRTPPALGRAFTPGETASQAARSVILSDTFWRTYFRANPNVIGQPLTLGDGVYTIVGVAAPQAEFRGDFPPQVFLPLAVRGTETARSRRWMWVIGRLRPDVTRAEALAEMRTLAQQMERENPRTNRNWTVKIIGLQELLTEKVRTPLLLLYVAAAFVLLIGCVNTANLLLARSEARRQEIAVRSAIGASRLRLVRQLLTESLLLACAGGALGSMLAVSGASAIGAVVRQFSRAQGISGAAVVHIDVTVWAFTILTVLGAGVLFGVWPALQASSSCISRDLHAGGRTVVGASRRRALHGFAVAQIALAFVLLVGAGLLTRSLLRLQSADPGFSPGRLLAVEMNQPMAAEQRLDGSRRAAYSRNVIERVESLPGVIGAASVSFHPFGGNQMSQGFQIEGRPAAEGADLAAEYRCVSGDYFQVAGIPLRSGRRLPGGGDPSEAVVDETFARRYFPLENPLGQRLRIHGRTYEIVGVAGRVKLRRLSEQEYRPHMYTPIAPGCPADIAFIARAARNPLDTAGAIRRAIREADPTQTILRTDTMESLVSDSIAPQRLSAALLAGFAGFALLLSALGVYGVMAFQVGQRVREMAVRKAFGARSRDVFQAVLRRGAILTGWGLGIGLGGALALHRLLASFLFGITPYDPATYACAFSVLALVALLACYFPAQRAARVDPIEALRAE